MKNILITGITGQDGLFLTDILFKKYSNISIIGISRNKNLKTFEENISCFNSKYLKNIDLFNIDLTNLNEVKKLIQKYKPTEIYNLTGPSSVYESFTNDKSKKNIVDIFSNLTNSLIELEIFPNFYQASSSEMFGKNNFEFQDELTKFNPNSPYAEAKLSNHLKVVELSEKYNWRIYSGIMFNHESEFRKQDFLFSKILDFLISNPLTQKEKLTIGSTDIVRDWSYAGDIVEGMITMTKSELRSDFVLGSGKSTSIEEVLETSFNFFDLNWRDYISIDNNLLRSSDPKIRISNPKKIKKELGWETKTSLEQTIEKITKYKKFKLQG